MKVGRQPSRAHPTRAASLRIPTYHRPPITKCRHLTRHHPQVTNRLLFISFADPYNLTPAESHRCKKPGAGAPSRLFHNRHFPGFTFRPSRVSLFLLAPPLSRYPSPELGRTVEDHMTAVIPLSDRSQPALPALAHWVDRALKELENLRKAPDRDAVHHVRVVLRRCRTLAAVMREVDPDPAWKQTRSAPRKL